MDDERAARFEATYRAHQRAVLAYVLRRTDDPASVADAVAETFLVLWRRLDDAPPDDQARPWLYGVARRVLANQRRSGLRRDALTIRLEEEVTAMLHARPPEASELDGIARAFGRLRPDDREVLALVGWEGLPRSEVAVALGVSTAVVRLRLHRARQRFAKELAREGIDTPVSTSPTSTVEVS